MFPLTELNHILRLKEVKKRERAWMLEFNLQNLILVLGVLVFLVNVIVEVTKNIYPLDKMHTNYYVTILSIVLTVLSYFMYLSYSGTKFVWYYLVTAIILGFLVAYIAMLGWEKLIKLWQQSKKGE